MKKALLSFILLAISIALYAAKSANISRTVTLQDGRIVTIHQIGDEYIHYLYDDEGEMIVKDTAGYRVATQAEIDEVNNTILEYSQGRGGAQAKAFSALRPNTEEGIYGYQLFPHTGKQKVLVLMAQFKDIKFTYGKETIDSMLNSPNVANTRVYSKSYSSGEETEIVRLRPYISYSSVREYFKKSSDGQFEPEFDVYGPYTLSGNMKTYGTGRNDNMGAFVPEVCSLADNDVDFSQYDSNGDGYVDIVYIIYAGYGANTSGDDDEIWAKCSFVSTNKTYDSKIVYRYGVNAELLGYDGLIDKKTNMPYKNGIGVFCHEFSHALGLPDIYPSVSWYYSGTKIPDFSKYDNQSMEDWDVMDNGLNVSGGCWPPLHSAFERELLGWGTIDTLSAPADVTMKPILHGGKAYRILNDNDPTGNEYWILEAISSDSLSETWHQYMSGKGLLVTHVNYNKNNFVTFNQSGSVNNVNNVPGAPGLTLLPADGSLPSSYHTTEDVKGTKYYLTLEQFLTEESGDPYPGSTNVTEITDLKPYTGTVNKPITDIAIANDFTVTFKFMGGATPVSEVKATVNSDTEDAYYTLDGRQLCGQPKVAGIYIKDGKKIVVK